jgi:hypothetical protein
LVGKKYLLPLLLALTLPFAYVLSTDGQTTIKRAASSITSTVTNIFTQGQGSAVVTGGQVVWTSGLTFRISAATYYIGSTLYSSAEQTVTLGAADASNPRIDVIVLDTTGTAAVVAGTAAASPSEPTVSSGTQLRLTIVLVPANASAPTVTNTTIYTENAGHPTEWPCTTSGSGFSCSSVASPRTNTTNIEGTTVTAGSYVQLAQGGGGTTDPAPLDFLVFYIKSKATWGNNRGLRVQLLSSGVIKGQQRTLQSGTYGFDSANVSAYQQVAIPMSDFAIPAGTLINQVRLVDFGGSIGFYVDDMIFQDGTAPTTGNFITQPQGDARYVQRTALLEYNAGNSSTALTIDWNNSNIQRLVLTGSATLTFSNPIAGSRYLLVITQDGTGSRTITWPAAVKWSSGTAPTLTTTASATDLCTFAYTGLSTGFYLAQCNLDLR